MEKRAVILVVDDEELNRRLMEAMLLSMGYEVLSARDGVEALQAAQDHPVDVILLDIMMPRMNGFEAARQLKEMEKTSHIPIVMVTALSEVNDRVKALQSGADDFLTKPVDQTELKARVHSLLQVKAYHDHMREDKKLLEEEVARKTEELRKAFEVIKSSSLDTIYRLSRAAEYRDEDTGTHIKRMSNYSAAVARKMSLVDKAVETLLYAAPMHDVGKIGIPDRILLKPGKLDADELDVMRQHTVFGSKILEGATSGFLRLAEVVALTHHEKWDGSGYPRGLKGKEIPLVGRIVAIADVFDALTTRRPYKEPFTLDKSYAIIRESRGSHFDPDVVDAFFAAEDEILSIKEKYKDEDDSLLYKLAVKPFS